MRGRREHRGAGSQLAAVASTRLDRLAQQWRPGSAPAVATPPEEPERAAEPRTAEARISVTPWSRSAVRGLVLLVCAAMTIAGWWWWSGRPREAIAAPTVLTAGAPLSGLAPTAGAVGADPPSPADAGEAPVAAPAVASVVVHVVGQVRHPGVVTLPAGSRVGDAVTAVGGVSKKGADDSVNLARVLVDGEQVIVGFGAQVVAGALGLAPSQAATLVNLNSADAAAFEQLPGVGPVLADRIVQWRTSNGPFRSVDELGEVSGIGDAIMGQLRSMVTV